jgi:hypothetical protein
MRLVNSLIISLLIGRALGQTPVSSSTEVLIPPGFSVNDSLTFEAPTASATASKVSVSELLSSEAPGSETFTSGEPTNNAPTELPAESTAIEPVETAPGSTGASNAPQEPTGPVNEPTATIEGTGLPATGFRTLTSPSSAPTGTSVDLDLSDATLGQGAVFIDVGGERVM